MSKKAENLKTLKAAQTAEEVRQWLWSWRGRDRDGLDWVAEHARVFDEPLVMMVLVGCSRPLALVENPALPEDLLEKAAAWLAMRLISEPAREGRERAEPSIEFLLSSGRIGPGDRAMEVLSSPFFARKPSEASLQMARRVLKRAPALPAELMETILSTGWSSAQAVERGTLALHPSTPLATRHRVLSEVLLGRGFNQTLLLEALRLPHITGDPELRPLLLHAACYARHIAPCARFLEEATPEEYAELFRLVVKSWPERAAHLLETYAEHLQGRIRQEEVVPLLSNPDARTREGAIRWLGRTHGPPSLRAEAGAPDSVLR